MSASELAILIPAAGAARRMGGHDKCLEEVAGEPALRHTARLAVATGARVMVTLPETGPMLPARQAALYGLGTTILPVKDAHEGMAASLRAGVRAAGDARGLMVLLPDMPGIDAAEIIAVIGAFARDDTHPVRGAAADGTPGHPVILPHRLFAEVAVLTGDEGAKRVLAGEEVRLVPLPGRRALTDLDTPEEWAAWRAGRL
jgi:CTP:molybdopterin cytidylyltransferase MocA